MKKPTLTLLALLALTLAGCGEIKGEYDVDKEPQSRISEFTRKGHKYLLYERYSGRAYGVAGITHDPDCPCREKGGENND